MSVPKECACAITNSSAKLCDWLSHSRPAPFLFPLFLFPFEDPPSTFFFFFFSSIYFFSFSSTSLCFPLVLNCFRFILFYFILTFMYRCKRVSHTKQAAMVREVLAKLKCKKLRDYNYNYIYLSNIKWVIHI